MMTCGHPERCGRALRPSRGQAKPPPHVQGLNCSFSTPFSDITDEDLEEAGVMDPGHKHLLLENLRLRK